MNDGSLRSPGVIIGGVLLLVMGAACSSGGADDDDCDSMAPTTRVFAAGGSGLRLAEPADQAGLSALPASGGFGTHLASCGG